MPETFIHFWDFRTLLRLPYISETSFHFLYLRTLLCYCLWIKINHSSFIHCIKFWDYCTFLRCFDFSYYHTFYETFSGLYFSLRNYLSTENQVLTFSTKSRKWNFYRSSSNNSNRSSNSSSNSRSNRRSNRSFNRRANDTSNRTVTKVTISRPESVFGAQKPIARP